MAQVTAQPPNTSETAGLPSKPSRPQPGDGAFLTTPRPRGTRGGHRGRGRGTSRQNGEGSMSGASSRGNTRPSSPHHEGEGGPVHIAQPREIVEASLGEADGTSHANGNGRGRGRGRGGHRGGRSIGGSSQTQRGQEAGKGVNGPSSTNPSLDPSAPIFSPQAPPHLADGPNMHPREHHSHLSHDHTSHIATQSKGLRSKPKPKPKTDTNTSPTPPISSRKTAFISGTKLTSTISRSSDEDRAVKGKKVIEAEKIREKEKDDLVSRLTRGLKSRPFLECPICFNAITPSQQIWCCLPPTYPPPPPTPDNPNPISPSSHYSACYTPFHLGCIKDWSNRSLAEEGERARETLKEGEVSWRCPGCQKRRADRVGGYRCFCERVNSPMTNTDAPHSCGESCSRKRPGCSHSCPLPCHPGPCPPCQIALSVPCPSHHTSLTVKCALASTNSTSLTPVCDETCDKPLSCDNRSHTCPSLCHFGECKPCEVRERVVCYCGREEKEEVCGWGKKDGRICKRFEDGEVVEWEGRWGCGRGCEGVFDCGVHPCEETCHPHPLTPLPCPLSPSKILFCPCSTTPLSSLPNPPRQKCTDQIPTCNSRCTSTRACGHQCPRKCHRGPCPPCREEVVRQCRCGESMVVIACEVLEGMAKEGRGGEVLCERVCKALRNCGRHECSRICCPLSYKAKNRKRKPNEEIDLSRLRLDGGDDDLHECHLTCGKLLGCGLHSCKKRDHRGNCGKCLEASYDELMCHCTRTIVYPPVACGTTLSCPYPCTRPPPPCGHPKSPHSCHESPDCPPCPYLTTKPCACGKDQSVKNVRCSQAIVSCGQTCNELLDCGFHRCERNCHPSTNPDGTSTHTTCTQACGKPKKICKHPCTSPCHAPAKCPESDPCQQIITQQCACGHLQTRNSCGASNSNQTSRENVPLKCNSECAIRQRNARLADALGIDSGRVSRVGVEDWSTELKGFARTNLGFVKVVEGTFKDFVEGGKQSLILPHMPQAKRTFVMSLADTYRLSRELIDEEPKRSVQIRRKGDSRIPTPLLSSVVTPVPAKPTFGGLANLRAPIAKVGSSALVPPGTVGGHASGSASNSAGPSVVTSRVATPAPAPAVVVPKAGEVKGKVGEVDEDDWDKSGDEGEGR